MGTDKAFVPVDGVPMARRVADALLAAGASTVAAIGGGHRLAEIGLSVVADDWPGEGPLGGLATALRWSPEAVVVVAGCDQPWLDAVTVRRLLGAHGTTSSSASATVASIDGRAQPLPGVYDTGLRPPLEAALNGGRRALSTALELAALTVVPLPDREPLRDVDEPSDLPGP